MSETALTGAIAFIAVASLTVLTFVLLSGSPTRMDQRLATITSEEEEPGVRTGVTRLAHSALPKLGTVLLPAKPEERSKLQGRLIRAGFYSRQAVPLFLGAKLLLALLPLAAAAAVASLTSVTITTAMLAGCLFSVFGLVAPSFWLDARKASRQAALRASLPDALDVLVVCLEGGASLTAAIQRVATELRTAHPILATELGFVQREMQLGRTAGQALREFAVRTDLEEVRSLAAVIAQSERFGASLVKALRVHAESLRTRRVLSAEEMAQKAVVKLLFPTVLFILPALFVAILGPFGIMILAMFRGLRS